MISSIVLLNQALQQQKTMMTCLSKEQELKEAHCKKWMRTTLQATFSKTCPAQKQSLIYYEKVAERKI